MVETSQLKLPLRRFLLSEIVQVPPEHGSACLGRIKGYEPGCGLRTPVDGWAYHIVLLLGADSLRERVVKVAEEKLRGLTED